MGYIAEGNGTIKIKALEFCTTSQKNKVTRLLRNLNHDIEKVTDETILDMIGQYVDVVEVDETHPEWKDVSVNAYGNYYDDDFTDLLNALKPILRKGTEIRFVGEDSYIWRYISRQDGAYVRDDGSIEDYWDLIDAVRNSNV